MLWLLLFKIITKFIYDVEIIYMEMEKKRAHTLFASRNNMHNNMHKARQYIVNRTYVNHNIPAKINIYS